jgi:5-methylcytosine-specific restriction endonuclease McrA
MIWNNTLSSVIKDDKVDTRCFTREFKQRLFEANPTCTICGNQINTIDDCAVDHIEQYWMGGRTIPENARLAHRFCNWSRPRKEN